MCSHVQASARYVAAMLPLHRTNMAATWRAHGMHMAAHGRTWLHMVLLHMAAHGCTWPALACT